MASIAISRRSVPASGVLARIVALVAALYVLAVASAISGDLGVFWVFGLAFGIILQRSRLCFASAFRDLFLLRDGGNLRAIATGLAVSTLGFALVQVHSVPTPAPDTLPSQAHLFPVGPQLIVGGIIFGLGMVLAGGCVSGTLYRVGEGYVGSFVALGGIGLGLVVSAQQWNWWWSTFTAHDPTIWLPGYFGYGGAIVVTLVFLGLVALATSWWELRAGPRPAFALRRPIDKPALTVRDWLDQRYRVMFRQGWPFLTGAVALAVLNVFVYLYDHPLGVTGEIGNWANRTGALVGVHAPTLLGASGLAGCLLVADPTASVINTGTMLDGGLIVGSLVAALFAGEFKLRFPRQRIRYVQSIGGGVLMGYGAGLAAGCTIGAFYSALPSLGLNGFVFGLALLVGAFGGVQIIKRL